MAQAGTEREYVRAIRRVLVHIQQNLDEPITPSRLADIACFSQHHFHRVFRAVVGESVMDHVRRLRMERAAHEIRDGKEKIGMIAFGAGYTAQEAFTRSFQAFFGVSPRSFRRMTVGCAIPAACGVHFGPSGFTPLRKPVNLELLIKDDLCPIHRESAWLFEEKWEELMAFIAGFGSALFPPSLRMLGLSPPLEENMTEVATADAEIHALEEEIEASKQRLNDLRRRRPKEEVKDYVFQNWDGSEVHLSELFGDKDDLIMVHNMGTGCSYCTMWADGFTGLVPHLSNRAAFVVSSPDTPDVQKRFAQKRNWNFQMISAKEGPFLEDMGFWKDGGPYPGVSTFRREGGRIYRVGKAFFGPGDDFCAVWPFLEMLDGGSNGWEPKYFYNEDK